MITKKNEKHVRLHTQLRIPGIQEAFSDKISLDIDDFTDDPEFQCDVQVLKNTFR